MLFLGKPEFKVTENRDGSTVYLGYGNDRYIRFRLSDFTSGFYYGFDFRNALILLHFKSLDFNLFRLKGSFKMADGYSSEPPPSSYGGMQSNHY